MGGRRSTHGPPASSLTSTRMTFINLLKAYLGTGLLAMPYAVQCAGLWVGVGGILFLCFISNHTLKMIVEMKRKIVADGRPSLGSGEAVALGGGGGGGGGGGVDSPQTHTQQHQQQHHHRPSMSGAGSGGLEDFNIDDPPLKYEDIGEHACGRPGRIVSVASMLITNVGISIGYIVFVAETLLETLQVAELPPPPPLPSPPATTPTRVPPLRRRVRLTVTSASAASAGAAAAASAAAAAAAVRVQASTRSWQGRSISI